MQDERAEISRSTFFALMPQSLESADQGFESELLINNRDGKLSGRSQELTGIPVEVPVFGFLYLGLVGLLCYNFFLQVIGLLAENTHRSFVTTATFAYALSNNAGQLICIFIGPYVSMKLRICFSCALIFAVSLGYPLVVNRDIPVGFNTGLGLTFALGVGNAIFQSAGFGLAATVGERALNYMSFGQSIAGVMCWPTLLLLKLFWSRLDVAYNSNSSSPSSWPVICGFAVVGILTIATIPYYIVCFSKYPAIQQALNPMRPTIGTEEERRGIWTIIWNTIPLALTVWLLLLVTFLVFPGVVLSWDPSFAYFVNNKSHYAEILIFTFQVFDAVGKLVALVGVRLSSFQVKLFTPWRLAWAILFFASGAGVQLLRNDFTRIALVAVLAFTNGILITWCMILGPSQVRKSEEEIAGYVMSFFLVFGITCGTFIAMYLTSVSNIRPSLEDGGAVLRMLTLNSDIHDFTEVAILQEPAGRIYSPVSQQSIN
jgi:hypothetical protein